MGYLILPHPAKTRPENGNSNGRGGGRGEGEGGGGCQLKKTRLFAVEKMAAHGQSEGWRLRAPSTLSKCVLEEADEMAYGCHLPHALGHCANVTSVTFEERGRGKRRKIFVF